MVHVIVSVAAFHTRGQAIDRGILRTRDANDLAIPHVQIKTTSYPAVRAGGSCLCYLAGASGSKAHLVVQSAHRTISHALSTAFAAGIQHELICTSYELGLEATVSEIPHVAVLDLAAGSDATTTQDALVAVNEDERIRVRIDFKRMVRAIVLRPVHAILVGQVL